MSIQLMTAAFKTPLPTTQKFVLVALCDSANDQGECYPSVSALMEKCSLSDRAVQKAILALEDAGYVRREPRHGRSTVYWLTATPEPRSPRTTFTPNDVHPTPERRSPPPPNVVHPTPEPRSPITINEPSKEPSGNRRERAALPSRPDDVTEKTWRDWCALRKAKKATVSETVLDGAREEAGKAGLTLERFLAVWCMRGSQGLQADWLKPAERGPARSPPEADSMRKAAKTAEAKRLLFGNQREIIDA